MNKAADDKTYHFFADNINISLTPKTEVVKEEEKEKIDPKEVIGKSRVIAILLTVFLGRFGVHKFYLGKPALGLLYLIFSRFQFVIFFCVCDIFIYLFMNEETWLKEYGHKKMPKNKKK